MFLDFGLMSGLLVLAHLVRSWVPLFQRIYLPTAILAGLMGLVVGPELLDLLPFARDGDGRPVMSRYPGELVILLFGSLFLGSRGGGSFAKMLKDAGDTFFYNLSGWLGQFGLALLFAGAVLIPLFDGVDGPFALMLPAGFVGGHGTATAVASVLVDRGFEDALVIGYTFATIGLLVAVLAGVVVINVATRAGWTRFVSGPEELPADLKRGFIEPENAMPVGRETVSPLAIDALTWHLGLILVTYAGAHGLRWIVEATGRASGALPMFALAMICGALLQKSLDGVGVGRFVDRGSISRLASSISDYLVAFGVASIRLTVVFEYAGPILVMCLFGLAHALFMLWVLAPRTFHNHWLERGLFTFGYTTGVVAMGIALLRVVDPKLESGALDDYGMVYVGVAAVEIVVLATLPAWVAGGAIWVPGAVLTLAAALLLIMSWRGIGLFPSDRLVARVGEAPRPT